MRVFYEAGVVLALYDALVLARDSGLSAPDWVVEGAIPILEAQLKQGISTLVEMAREGFRRTREVLAPFTVLLWPSRQSAHPILADDDMPPEIMVGDVPGWALDTYTREGRRALKLFLQSDCASARWINANVPAGRRVNLRGNIVFRIEGGLVSRRSRWPMADELRYMVDVGSHGPACVDATEILQLMRDEIPALNGVRLRLNGGSN
jgi:hypothetical protein